jgi:hypothetical protein
MPKMKSLISRKIKIVFKQEINVIEHIIAGAMADLETNHHNEWQSLTDVFYTISCIDKHIAEMKAALRCDQDWNFVPDMTNEHALAYTKLAIEALQEEGEPISDEIGEKILYRMNAMFNDYSQVDALKKARFKSSQQ